MKYIVAFIITGCLSAIIAMTILISRAVKENAPTVLDVSINERYEAHWLFMRDCIRKNSLKDCENAK